MRKNIYVFVYKTEPLCHTAEINTALQINYPSINAFLKRKLMNKITLDYTLDKSYLCVSLFRKPYSLY